MRVQITLTVNESKRLIAKGIARIPIVRQAKKSGKIFLKGGTTVSAVCEELIGKPLHISGRISPQGTRTAQFYSGKFHCAVIANGKLFDVDSCLEKTIESLKADDVAIIGANAIDNSGNSAMMFGAPLGDEPGRIISGLIAEIKNIFIVAGLEKLIPGSISDVVLNTGRKTIDLSMGMAVGLIPISGKVITEKEAVALIADVEVMVIGKGGIQGAEGATTMMIEGDRKEVERVFAIVSSIKGATVSGIETSLSECAPPHERCKLHRACIYKKSGRLSNRTFSGRTPS